MSNTIAEIQGALARAAETRPEVGEFPYLAENLRQAGVRRNHWFVAAMTCVFDTKHGSVINQGNPLTESGFSDAQPWNKAAVVEAIRGDQKGESTFPEFMRAIHAAGVIRYEVDFDARTCTYYAANGAAYTETYPAVTLPMTNAQ